MTSRPDIERVTPPQPSGPVVERVELIIRQSTGWSSAIDRKATHLAKRIVATLLAEIEAERLEYASDDPDSAEMRVIDDIVKRLTGETDD